MPRAGATARGVRPARQSGPGERDGFEPDEKPEAPGPTRMQGIAALLGAEHGYLAALFARARQARAQGRLTEAGRSFDGFRRDLLRHLRVEEELVFPAFEIRVGLPSSGPTATMRSEHGDIRNRLAQLAVALDEGYEASELEHSLVAMLAEHNRREEAILFPVLDGLLSCDESQVLAAGLRSSRS